MTEEKGITGGRPGAGGKERVFLDGSRLGEVNRAKPFLIYLGTHFRSESVARMGELTGMSAQAASKAKERGRAFWKADRSLSKLIN